MRLLVISASFAPIVGGAETYAMDISRGLAARGHEVTIATDVPHGQRPEGPFADPDSVVVRRFSDYLTLLDDPGKLRWEQMAYSLMPELAACAEESRPELILTNSLDTATLGKTLALEFDVPWAATFHEHSPEDEPLGRGRLRFVYEVLRPSLVLAGSRFYAERAQRWGAEVPMQLIYHGVDTEVFRPDVNGSAVRASYGFGSDHLVILCAGRFKPRKGIHDLVQAFSSVHEAQPLARLLVVGSISSASADYAARLVDDVERLGLQDVVTIDQTVTFDRMPSILAAADVVAQPSLEEGLGLSVLEAMSCGRAVVTTDVIGVREIFTARDIAVVVPPAQPRALAEALSSLLEAPEFRQYLGMHAREHVKRGFSRNRTLSETEAALGSLLEHTKEPELADV